MVVDEVLEVVDDFCTATTFHLRVPDNREHRYDTPRTVRVRPDFEQDLPVKARRVSAWTETAGNINKKAVKANMLRLCGRWRKFAIGLIVSVYALQSQRFGGPNLAA